MNSIAVLVPVFDRAHRVAPLIHSFHHSKPKDALLIFIASPGDKAELAALNEHADMYMVAPFPRNRGDWAKKINHGYRNTDTTWVLCAADDIHFHPGWDRALRNAARVTGKRVLGTNDLNPNANPDGIYSPHPLVARSYADERGTVDRKRLVVAEVYDHNYPDRELAATAIARDEWAFVSDSVVEHLHPSISETPADHTYRLGSKMSARDYNLYVKRIRLWERERILRERKLRGRPVRHAPILSGVSDTSTPDSALCNDSTSLM